MAFGELGISSIIALNAPKYREIIEPFGDSGSIAFFLGKRKPKNHIVNYENEDLFKIMTFIKNVTSQQKRQLKAKDWVGSFETFDIVVKINATDGVDFFYKFFYLRNFTERVKDKEAPPKFDFLKLGEDVKNILFKLPQQKMALKIVTLLNENPAALITKGGGDTFTILAPMTGEQVEMIESKLKSIRGNYFYAKKSLGNDFLLDALKSTDENVIVIEPVTIKITTTQVITNYESRLVPLDISLIDVK